MGSPIAELSADQRAQRSETNERSAQSQLPEVVLPPSDGPRAQRKGKTTEGHYKSRTRRRRSPGQPSILLSVMKASAAFNPTEAPLHVARALTASMDLAWGKGRISSS